MMKMLNLTLQRLYGGWAFFSILCLIVGVFGLNVDAYAQEEEEDYEDMAMEELLAVPVEVASASSEQAKSVFNTPSAVTVIDKSTIQKYGFQNVSEALTIVPGMSVYRNYFRRNIPTSRGLTQYQYSNKVLLMINGVPTFGALNGEANIDRISIHDLERIEVLKGPASVVYGSNAYSGAINLVLKKTSEFDDTDIEVEAKAGTEYAFEGNGRYVSEDDESRLFISGGGRKDAGDGKTFTGEDGVSGSYDEFTERAHVTFDGRYQDHSLLLNAYNTEESYLGIYPAFAGGAGKDLYTRGYLADYHFDPKLSDTTNLSLGGTFDWNYVNYDRSEDGSLWATHEGYRWVAYSKLNSQISERLGLNLGASYEHRESVKHPFFNKRSGEVVDDNGLDGVSVYESAVFADVTYDASPVTLTLGTRFTDNELFGSDLSSRGAIVYQIDNTNSLKLMVGQAFRSPSLFELYVDNAVLTGNQDLDPETSLAYELAYVTSVGKMFMQVLGYYAEYDDKIQRNTEINPDGSTFVQYRNGDEFSAIGAELELRYIDPEFADIFLNYQVVDGDDGDKVTGTDNYNFKYVPENTLALGVSKRFGRMFSSLVVNYQDEAEGPNEKVDDAWTFDAQIGYNHKTELGLIVRHAIVGSNIFDEEVSFAEYNRLGTLNEVSNGYGRRVLYTASVKF